ncbi:MAG: 4-hydroxy-3-methylbut-2-enyl diphosphate reductase [Planctomycetes bacterium]|nr:4-hydroxy-3-methylbut-2-enyl diphosphate reductase [Planctomycetota bacterium]
MTDPTSPAETAPPAAPPPGDRYFRKGLGLRGEVKEAIAGDYHSDLVRRFREEGYVLRSGDVTFRLAREFGFCYGVERAVDYAYQAVERFPDRRVILTGEIIHNPGVNGRLRAKGVRFVGDADVKTLDDVVAGDVVLLPAFGVPASDFERLSRSGAVLVDTTCGSVLNVWKSVERYARDGFTSVVHGKWAHEETRATVSRVLLHPEGRYLVVLDLAEADLVADWIRRGGDREAFLARFARATSPGFDPARDLARIGVANQTTMLSGESLEIARRLGAALADRYGPEEGRARFRAFDTICSATQDRQDALEALIREPLDLLLVVGGFNSSNTAHLAELAHGKVPAFHIEGPDGLLSREVVRHRPVGGKAPVETSGWLPQGPVVVGVTAGASTPDVTIGAVVARVLALRGPTPPAAAPPAP